MSTLKNIPDEYNILTLQSWLVFSDMQRHLDYSIQISHYAFHTRLKVRLKKTVYSVSTV